MIDPHGSDIAGRSFPNHQLKSTSWDTLYYRLRANFDSFSSKYCEVPAENPDHGAATYMDGCTVTNVHEEHNSLRILYRDIAGTDKEIEGDLLIASDGPNSQVRRILQPNVEREYVGYIGWRGTVPEAEISIESRKILRNSSLLYPIENSCALS